MQKTSFFHKVINKRSKHNEIMGVSINNQWCEEVEEVKRGSWKFFKNHFEAETISRKKKPFVSKLQANLTNREYL